MASHVSPTAAVEGPLYPYRVECRAPLPGLLRKAMRVGYALSVQRLDCFVLLIGLSLVARGWAGCPKNQSRRKEPPISAPSILIGVVAN